MRVRERSGSHALVVSVMLPGMSIEDYYVIT
jgi:hypothetical protein